MMPERPTLDPGTPTPLGATWDGHGVHFAVFSRHAEKIELCLFDGAGHRETARLALPARSGDVWHGYLPGAAPGLAYGYRAHGPYAPSQGHRFNPHKLLLDPYARMLSGRYEWHDAVHGYRDGTPDAPHALDTRDSAPYVPRCRVVQLPANGERPPRPHTPWHDTVIYEVHPRGFTQLHPDIDPALRGTLAALAEPALIDHYRRLGITALQLLPTAAFLDELHLVRHGLRNYWGYNPIAFMAPHAPYLGSGGIGPFVAVIDRLHRAGLEVILDVVFNHTAEGDARGPTLSLRGLDNAVYYRLEPGHAQRYRDTTGCGNTLDLSQPVVVDLVHAALRHWACEIGVDGFRFDLAASLVRDGDGRFDPAAPLLQRIAGDPDLRDLKWIAEPWDLGMPGYFLGAFPPPLAEWNDRYRDATRRFWRGDAGLRGELVTRLAGSSDVFASESRASWASLNFVTAHDGFTLADLTAYAHKHNLANGEDDRDGSDENWSRNGGVEGHSDDPDVLGWRRRVRQSLLGTLLLSRGTPMLRAGDELSQTQYGNNNAYCQDNPLSWLDWSARGDPWRDLCTFLEQATRLRRQLRLLHGDRHFTGRALADAPDLKDVAWLEPDGAEVDDGGWHDDRRRALAMRASGAVSGNPPVREHLFLAFNAADAMQSFRLPSAPGVDDWLVVLDSSAPPHPRAGALHAPGETVETAGGGLLALVPRHADGLGVPEPLRARARAAGVSAVYTDIAGHRLQVPAQGLSRILEALGDTRPEARTATPALPGSAPARPARCWLPESLAQAPGRWALSVQVYSLRSPQGWGIGDFEDLAQVLEVAADAGADGVLCSPVHALSPSQPQRASPYAPVNRLMLHPLLISIEEAAREDVPEALGTFADRPDVRQERLRLNEADHIDYPAVAALKMRALRHLHGAFRQRHLDPGPTPLGEAFQRFRRDGGRMLRDHAVFEALHAHFAEQLGHPVPWTQWPAALRDPRSPETEDFEHRHARSVEFHAYLQWLARRQWRAAAARGRARGMGLGLIADVALGADLDSVEAWQWPGLVALDAELGAPPDDFAPQGQRWGAPPWRPQRLAETDFAPFDALLDANMREAGAIRIDHILGLLRQFWIPRGAGPEQGAYVAYPLEALLERVAEASRRHRCAVIGEDLGNVPDGLRERLAQAQVLGFRVTWFERDRAGRFRPPDSYVPLTAASISTHDLPTAAGFRKGLDIDERIRRGLFLSAEQAATARHARDRALTALHTALAPYEPGLSETGFTLALHRHLAACTSRLAIVQIEDVLGVQRQANLPGLGDETPNWRQRLPVGVDALAGDARLRATSAIFAARAGR